MANSGLNFAQSLLEKYGWSEGKGLGREEGGITEPIKAKLKFNSTGLGYDLGESFKFQWWDHVFNKTASSITVNKDQNGVVELQQSQNLKVSTKRTSQNTNKSKFYGGFVKGGTLVGQTEHTDSSDSEEDQKEEEDMSLKLSDEQLFKICQGRTAHKGARHGLNMTAKLARVREQELVLQQAWEADNTPPHHHQHTHQPLHKKKKKKKSSKNKDVEVCVDAEPSGGGEGGKKQKNERKCVLQEDEEEGRNKCVSVHHQEPDEPNPAKKRKKKHKTQVPEPSSPDLSVVRQKKKKKKKEKD